MCYSRQHVSLHVVSLSLPFIWGAAAHACWKHVWHLQVLRTVHVCMQQLILTMTSSSKIEWDQLIKQSLFTSPASLIVFQDCLNFLTPFSILSGMPAVMALQAWLSCTWGWKWPRPGMLPLMSQKWCCLTWCKISWLRPEWSLMRRAKHHYLDSCLRIACTWRWDRPWHTRKVICWLLHIISLHVTMSVLGPGIIARAKFRTQINLRNVICQCLWYLYCCLQTHYPLLIAVVPRRIRMSGAQ